ncbi:unnamed protein product [Caenorhabditis angaria]|uniref:Uncharacterized protein n=1 Tax=Caenorhabditis angaria TaxID=860376 RepID=A0A9P1IVR6_9PELO|nr:unnamed protein product [Caenorhabditis angaria]
MSQTQTQFPHIEHAEFNVEVNIPLWVYIIITTTIGLCYLCCALWCCCATLSLRKSGNKKSKGSVEDGNVENEKKSSKKNHSKSREKSQDDREAH